MRFMVNKLLASLTSASSSRRRRRSVDGCRVVDQSRGWILRIYRAAGLTGQRHADHLHHHAGPLETRYIVFSFKCPSVAVGGAASLFSRLNKAAMASPEARPA